MSRTWNPTTQRFDDPPTEPDDARDLTERAEMEQRRQDAMPVYRRDLDAVETQVAYAMTRTNAAAYSTLQDALNAGAGGTVYIGPGAYSISAALTAASGTTVELHPNAVIAQTTAFTPVFDLLDTPDVRIVGGQFEWNGSRAFVSGGTVRGDSGSNRGAGVWTNSEHTTVEGGQFFGFLNGVCVSGWNGTALTAGHTKGVMVQDVAVDTVNFGVLAFGTTDLTIRRLTGSYAAFSGTPPPPHLIYLSQVTVGAGMNITPNMADCYCDGGDTSYVYQFKGVTGGSARNLYAGTAPSLVNVMYAKRFRVENAGIENATSATEYAVSFQVASAASEVDGVVIRGVDVGNVAGGRLATMQGQNCELADLTANTTTATTSTSTGHILVTGQKNTVARPRITEIGAGAFNAVHVTAGSGHRIERPVATGVGVLVRVISPGTATVTYDPTASTAAQAGMVWSGAAADRLVLDPTRVATTVASGTVTPNPTRETVTAITVTGATVAIANPPALTMTTGARHTIELTNGSAGALTVTWGTQYVFGPAWASPAAGGTTFITFQYNGTSWVEVSRT